MYCANHDEFKTLRYQAFRIQRTMGSDGMGRAPISVAVSGPNPVALSPHETVSLTIQLIYPEGLILLFQYCRTYIRCQNTHPSAYS
jgi:hypothetical protein